MQRLAAERYGGQEEEGRGRGGAAGSGGGGGLPARRRQRPGPRGPAGAGEGPWQSLASAGARLQCWAVVDVRAQATGRAERLPSLPPPQEAYAEAEAELFGGKKGKKRKSGAAEEQVRRSRARGRPVGRQLVGSVRRSAARGGAWIWCSEWRGKARSWLAPNPAAPRCRVTRRTPSSAARRCTASCPSLRSCSSSGWVCAAGLGAEQRAPAALVASQKRARERQGGGAEEGNGVLPTHTLLCSACLPPPRPPAAARRA